MAAALAVAEAKVSAEGPWRRTFGWPQKSSGKPFCTSERESRAWPRLCSTVEENCRLGNIARRWKEQFEDLLNLSDTSSVEETESKDLPISPADNMPLQCHMEVRNLPLKQQTMAVVPIFKNGNEKLCYNFFLTSLEIG